jgi:hypothetical protein
LNKVREIKIKREFRYNLKLIVKKLKKKKNKSKLVSIDYFRGNKIEFNIIE